MSDPSESSSQPVDTGTGSDSETSRKLQIRCPECGNSVEVDPEASFSSITCDACDNHFGLTGEEATLTYGPAAQPLRLAHFELLDHLGTGQFGSVYKARDLELDRVVAVKIPRRGEIGPGEREQFFREARTAAQLRHPNIVGVHEVGESSGIIYIVTDYIEGLNLAEWLKLHRPRPIESVELCRKVAFALEHAHQAYVIHRDLKPSNVLIDQFGEPFIADFGLARREAGEPTVTLEGKVLGTPAYMSPEQADGKSHCADCRSDVYSLGVILFEMLTGERPFRGSARMLLYQVLHDAPPSPRKLNSTVPRDLETVCLKCLEKDPRQRYGTARALAEELGRFLNGQGVEARPVGALGRMWRWYRHNPYSATLVAGTYTMFLAIALSLWTVFGFINLLTGLHPGGNTLRNLLENAGFLLILWQPLLWAAVATLNGRRWGPYASVAVLAVASSLGIALATGTVHANLLAVTQAEQLVPMLTLLELMAAIGISTNVVAILSARVSGG